MNRDTFSHIRLWCPRPFGTYSQNKPYGGGTGGSGPAPSLCKADAAGRTSIDGGGGNGPEDDEDAGTENTPPTTADNMQPPPPPAPPSPTTQVEDGRVLLDTWYVIKPGNTKEKIAFFVAHQFSGTGLPRPSAMKVKGNWATDCTKAKRRRRCSSYDPPARSPNESSPAEMVSAEDGLGGVSETDLLSVAEMVALVEQRTAMALQGMVVQGQTTTPSHNHHHHQQVNNIPSVSDTDTVPVVYMSEDTSSLPDSSSDLDEQQQEPEQQLNDTRRVAQAVAHYESQQSAPENVPAKDQMPVPPGGAPPKATHGRGEVRIAFRVSSLDSRSQSEPAGRPRCMFMSCGSGSTQTGARSKEKITCDLYQLVSPSSRDPSLLLAGSQKSDAQGDINPDRPPSTSSSATPDPNPDLVPAEKKNVSRERVTGFHVEVVVTGAVDQCVFYGKDSTENVQEETVCFAKPGGGGSSSDVSEDPPPGQLFFLQPPTPDEEVGGKNMGVNGSLDCANNNNSSSSSNGPAIINGGNSGNGAVVGTAERPDSPLPGTEDCAGGDSSSLCRLYRHVSHDFLEIRFQIQRLLEPRQYMLSLPDHIMVNIFSYLPTRSLAALKCTCHDFKALIEMYGVRATDSRWNQDPLYRDDPCKQCKRQYERGDVSLCRWHPKPYHHDLPYGRSYWMCCRRTDKDTPGCRVGLHDNNWVQPCDLVQTRSKRDDGR